MGKISFNFKAFKYLCEISEKELYSFIYAAMGKLVKKGMYQLHKSDTYLFYESISTYRLPVLLVSHLDTVPDLFNQRPQSIEKIIYRGEPTIVDNIGGLGADDRAGVFGILSLIKAGYYPSVLFACQEEIGGIGAAAFAREVKELNNINFVVELDRQGAFDSVFYSCKNKEFESWINNYGFRTASGSFSDISVICPAFNIAGVNLSIGYYQEHTNSEFLVIRNWEETIEKVKQILVDSWETKKFDF